MARYTRDADGRVRSVSVTPPGGNAISVFGNVAWLPFGPADSFAFAAGRQTPTKSYDKDYRVSDVTSNVLGLHWTVACWANAASTRMWRRRYSRSR